MFTGIIEEAGTVTGLKKNNGNFDISVKASFLKEIKIDQSIAHNGVCLTVVKKNKNSYTVTAIKETLSRTNLRFLNIGDEINLERCMKADARFDGHIVQGHVDYTAIVRSVQQEKGSRIFKFKTPSTKLIVEKGSVCVNGVSLTVVDVVKNGFSVAIIPYTFQHTNFHALKIGDRVNIEYDIIGKYVAAIMKKNR